MKKRILALTMIISASMLFGACGKKAADEEAVTTEDAVKVDVVEFVSDELPAIKADRDSAIGIYNAYFEQENVDVEKFKTSLKDEAIPKMETYLEELNKIETSTTEVADLKALYCQSAQRQYDAMKMVLSALDGENSDYLTQAENLLNESKEYAKQYDDKLQEVASKHNIKINKK